MNKIYEMEKWKNQQTAYNLKRFDHTYNKNGKKEETLARKLLFKEEDAF